MAKERLTIGELSEGRYRLYGDEALVRLELVRTLREAGLSLDSIKKVLRRETSLAEALSLRLAAIEAHLASLSRIRAALRAALRSEPTEYDVRRICAVTRRRVEAADDREQHAAVTG